jgi:hypothetical protein
VRTNPPRPACGIAKRTCTASAPRSRVDLIQRRRTDESLAARIRELTALCQFTDRLQRAESPEDVYEPALDAILDALQCSRASILLRDCSGVMRFVASRGLSDPYRRAVDGHSPWDSSVKDEEPICVDDVAQAAFPEPLKRAVIKEGIHALSFIPLQPAGRLIGKVHDVLQRPSCVHTRRDRSGRHNRPSARLQHRAEARRPSLASKQRSLSTIKNCWNRPAD